MRPLLKLSSMTWLSWHRGPGRVGPIPPGKEPDWPAFERQLRQDLYRIEGMRPHLPHRPAYPDTSWRLGWPTCIATLKDGSTRCGRRPMLHRKTKAPRNGLCARHGSASYPVLDPKDLFDLDGLPLRRQPPGA